LAISNFEWPVEKDKKYQISSTFGESRIDHFHNGIDLPGEGIKILAPKAARTLFKISGETIPGEMPFGGGKTLVLDHGDNSWSGYMHLKSFGDGAQKDTVQQSEILGFSGNSGHSGGAHLHFFIYDAAEGAMLNPLALLSGAYYRDTRAPEFKEWGVVLPEKFANVNPEKSFRLSGDYGVFAFIQDHGIGRERWGVFEYAVKIDGKEVQRAKFDKIFFKDSMWRLGSGQIFEDIFFRNYYSLTPQVRRAKKIAIEARDIKGNLAAKEYELKIQQN